MSEHSHEPALTLRERVEALAYALWVAGLRSGEKDGRPRLIAEGVYANLNIVQRLDICRITAADVGTRLAADLAATRRKLEASEKLLREVRPHWLVYKQAAHRAEKALEQYQEGTDESISEEASETEMLASQEVLDAAEQAMDKIANDVRAYLGGATATATEDGE